MIDFDPVVGSEQGGFRPAVVISNNFVISKTNIVYICPVTSKQGKTALNVTLDESTKTSGAVLCAQCKAVDLKRRRFRVIEELPKNKLVEILDVVISTITPSE
jgi:mRNA interferase MazF